MDHPCQSTRLSKKRKFFTSESCLFYSFCVVILFGVVSSVSSYGDPVYIRKSNGYLQLLGSDTLRWVKQGTDDKPLKLTRPNVADEVICRVEHTSLRGVGTVSPDQSVCTITTPEGTQGAVQYQTLTTSASRLIWKLWQRPHPPPMGAVAIAFKPVLYLAVHVNSSKVGYLDPNRNLGSAIFPNERQAASSCLVLTEVGPERYELSDLVLRRNKGFIEEEIVLAYGKLTYDVEKASELESCGKSGSQRKGKVESILSYETDSLDNWGQGYLMAKGLPTQVRLEDGTVKVIEWGIPHIQTGKTDTMTAVAELYPGTGLNVTLRGIRIDGEMSYRATLKTIFKDGFASTRILEGHRRVKDIQEIRLAHSKIYSLCDGGSVLGGETATLLTTKPVDEFTSSEESLEDFPDGKSKLSSFPSESTSSSTSWKYGEKLSRVALWVFIIVTMQ